MKRKLLSLLVLLMTAVMGAWADNYLYLVVEGTSATLKYGVPPSTTYFTGEEWVGDISTAQSTVKTVTADASCGSFDGTELEALFSEFTALTSVNLSGLATSSVENMRYLFCDCSSLGTLDLSGWDTSNVEYMEFMFSGCSALTTLTFGSGWKTSKVMAMLCMFDSCSSLGTLNISGWDTSNVEDMSWMFYNCSSLSTLDLSGWDTSNVTDMSDMFDGCSNLETLNLTGWDTSSVTSMDDMFYDCTKLNMSVTANEGKSCEYWSTFYAMKSYNFQAPSGTKVFVVDVSGSSLTMTEITDGIIKSSKAVVLKSTSADITLTPTIAAGTGDYSNNKLQGVLSVKSNPSYGNVYVLNKGSKGVGFYKLKSDGYIQPNKAYLVSFSSAPEYFLFDDATDIEGVSVNDSEIREVYDLHGRRVSQPTKGLYIVNGKKVVIK